jgi:hypothetical protein
LVWLANCTALETDPTAGFGNCWPVPLGSDVRLSYLAGRWVFGSYHRALHLVLLIAVIRNFSGLVVQARATPPDALRPVWLVLPLVSPVGIWWFYDSRAHACAPSVDRQVAHVCGHPL